MEITKSPLMREKCCQIIVGQLGVHTIGVSTNNYSINTHNSSKVG